MTQIYIKKYKTKERKRILRSERFIVKEHEIYKKQNQMDVENYFFKHFKKPLVSLWVNTTRQRLHLAPFRFFVFLRYPLFFKNSVKEIRATLKKRYEFIKKIDRFFQFFFKINRKIRDYYGFSLIYRKFIQRILSFVYAVFVYKTVLPSTYSFIEGQLIIFFKALNFYNLFSSESANFLLIYLQFVIIAVIISTLLKMVYAFVNLKKSLIIKICALLTLMIYLTLGVWVIFIFSTNARLFVTLHIFFTSLKITEKHITN